MKSSIKRTFFPAIFILIVSLTSCSKSGKQPTFIPKNAGVVAIINGKSLNKKSGINDLTTTKFYKLIKSKLGKDEVKTLNEFKPLIQNPDESGIDFRNDIYLFAFTKDSVRYLAIHMKLLDKSKFEGFINKIIKKSGKKITINSLGNYSYLATGEKSPVIMWDRKQLFVLIDPRHHNNPETNAGIAKRVLSEDKSESIVSTHKLDEFIKNKKDISLWFINKDLMNKLPFMKRMPLPSKVSLSLSGKTNELYCDFQKGQVVVTFSTKFNKQIKSAMEKNDLFKDKFNPEILHYFPQKSYINFFGAVNLLGYYNLMMKQMAIYKVNAQQITQIFQATFDMSPEEALGEFSGEMGFDIYGFKFVKAKHEKLGQIDSIPVPLFGFGIAFKSDKFYNAIINKFGALFEHKDGYYQITKGKSTIYFNLFDKTLVATNDLDLIRNIVSGSFKSHSLANSEVGKNLRKHPIFASIDLNLDHYPKGFKRMIKEKGGDKADAIFNMLSMYDKIEYLPLNKYNWKMIVRLKNRKANSLKTLLSGVDNNLNSLN